MGKHNKDRRQDTQQLRPIPGDGLYVPMESRRSYVLRLLSGVVVFSIVITLVILLSVLLVGCSSIDAGEVIDKDHDSAYTTTVCQGKPLICTPHYHPEKWELRVKANGETGWVRVSKHEYEKYNVGDWYP